MAYCYDHYYFRRPLWDRHPELGHWLSEDAPRESACALDEPVIKGKSLDRPVTGHRERFPISSL